MMRPARQNRGAVAGFTLIEALAALVLMGLIMASLANITAQWLPNWNRGLARTQRSELVSIALDRLVADLGAAEFVTANRDSRLPMFEGSPTAVTLIRSSFGPNAGPGLETVRIAETADRNGTVLVRSRMPFVPRPVGMTSQGPTGFSNPVALLRAPFRVRFAYAGRDGIWEDNWQNAPQLPKLVRLTVRDATSGRALAISTIAPVHVELPAACNRAKDRAECIRQPGTSIDAPANDPSKPAAGAPAAPGNQRNAAQNP